MPAVTIRLTGELPARARRRPPRRWVMVRPAAPLDPDRRQRLGTPGRRSTSKRRDCRTGRGGRTVCPRESQVRTRRRLSDAGGGAPADRRGQQVRVRDQGIERRRQDVRDLRSGEARAEVARRLAASARAVWLTADRGSTPQPPPSKCSPGLP